MSASNAALAAEFDQHRSRLIGIGYRLTGRLADAEDAVQDAWLRLASTDREDIRDLGGWLTTVVSRLCLDRMRSAAVRREQYVGPWLPEPLVSSLDQDPGDIVAGQDDLRMAALRVLHELPPDQRLAFVLHDGFDVPFAEIAEVLGCSVAAARQHASRARRVMADAEPPPRVPLPEQQKVLEEFLAAVASKDIGAITRVLHPTVTVYGDSGGKARTARRPVAGIDKVARFIVGLLAKYGDGLVGEFRPVLVNGDLGMLFPGTDTLPEPHVFTLAVRDGRPAAIFDIVNPDKLTRVPW
ncbi:sigma-70 family RNA polymerase sigma factor [Saccharopolyspora sp. K220]|uniref:sigma-70 family RNA polymerase sigma factor n=1 Tax=Saccharopolyspora soli TaxID=2926618 RepID=UPI001F5783E9|nr:sigma-70 family RNA polymerase sigma factor [Saccharopolyspora soli]MCI2420932.1 sigma-70 family RNA polymerase sigma factor [Saccharopolyspora soli]